MLNMNENFIFEAKDFLHLAIFLEEVPSTANSSKELLLCAYEQGFGLSEICLYHAKKLLGEL